MTARKLIKPLFIMLLATTHIHLFSQNTRLLRQPAISNTQIAFTYGGDIWVTSKTGGDARRITSTATVKANHHFHPPGNGLPLVRTVAA